MIKGVSIFRMGESLLPREDGMKVTNHQNSISYEKLVPHLFHYSISFGIIVFSFLFNQLVFLFNLSFQLWISISILFSYLCRYNQIDKHLKNKALQCIITRELKGNHLLQYDEAFSEEKEAFEKTKVHVIICLFLIFVLLVSIFFLLQVFIFCVQRDLLMLLLLFLVQK